MITKVKVSDIKPNPFQPRKEFDAESIDMLAKEIGKVGLWKGSIRGRQDQEGKVELCFGHRRLQAVKKLGMEEIEIEIVPLSDTEMALQALIENLQRQGLNDADKGDAIVAYVKLRKQSSNLPTRVGNIKEELRELLGISVKRIEQLLEIARLEEHTKERIRKREVAGSTVIEAFNIADNSNDFVELVDTAADKEISTHKLEKIGRKLREIPDATVRAKVKKKVVKGELTDPESVEAEAKKIARKQRTTGQSKKPPDLILVVGHWTEEIRQWACQLDQVIPYTDYIDSVPAIAGKFRAEVRKLIERLQKFV